MRTTAALTVALGLIACLAATCRRPPGLPRGRAKEPSVPNAEAPTRSPPRGGHGPRAPQATVDPMDFLGVLATRRSIRAFSEEPVTERELRLCLKAATLAPSAGNVQPWQFFVVRDRGTRQALARAALGQMFLAQAPVVIVVCADLKRAAAAYGRRGRELYSLQDTAAATQNLLLMAHALGLGTCWVGAFDEQAVARVLKLPGHLRPVALVPVGRPAQRPASPGRRPLSEVVRKFP